MQPSLTTLVDQLRAAFPAKPIQSEGAFHDWGATYPDAEPYAKQLEGRTWEEVDCAYLITRSDALGFLGTRQLVAVLPVYLRSLIEDGVWSHAADPLLLLLTKPGPDKKTGLKLPRFEALVGALTPTQRSAIALVLSAFAATDETGSLGMAAHTALQRYWKTYLPDGL